MIKIKRRIEGKTDYHEIYAKDEALQKGLSFVPWKDAQVGEYAVTDDGYVGLCYGRKNYTDKNGRLKTFIKLTCGVGWVTPFSRIDF